MKKILMTLCTAFSIASGVITAGVLGSTLSLGLTAATSVSVARADDFNPYINCINSDSSVGQAQDASSSSRSVSERKLQSNINCQNFLTEVTKTKNSDGKCDSTCQESSGNVFESPDGDRYQTVACSVGYTGNKTQRSSKNPNGTYSPWVDFDTSQCSCASTSGSQAAACPTGYSGTRILQRNWTCTGNTGNWSDWAETSNTCAAPVPRCTPLGIETNVQNCAAPSTGTFTQTRNSTCPTTTGSPVWSGWTTTIDNCAPIPDLTIAWRTPNATYTASAFDSAVLEIKNISTVNSSGPISFTFDIQEPTAITEFDANATSVVVTNGGATTSFTVSNSYWSLTRDGTKVTVSNAKDFSIPAESLVYVSIKIRAKQGVQRMVSPIALLAPTSGNQNNTTNDSSATTMYLNGGKLCVPDANQTQELSCQAGYLGVIKQHRVSSCPAEIGDPVWGGWITDSNSCEPECVAADPQTQTLACPTGQIGSIVQKRISLCANPTGLPTWQAWTTVSNDCVVPCAPLPTQSQTLACPSGQIGAITQQRTSVCTDPRAAPTWNAWATITNTCATPCVPNASQQQGVACPAGYIGSTVQQRDSYCPATTGAPAWGGWYYVYYNCQPACQPQASQQQWVGCPAYNNGGILQQRDSYCPSSTGSPAFGGWYNISYQCTPWPNPVGPEAVTPLYIYGTPYMYAASGTQIDGQTRFFQYITFYTGVLVRCPAPYQAYSPGIDNYLCYL